MALSKQVHFSKSSPCVTYAKMMNQVYGFCSSDTMVKRFLRLKDRAEGTRRKQRKIF